MKLRGKWVLALLLVSGLMACSDRDSHKYAQFYVEKALSHSRNGDLDQAIADLNHALVLNPKFAEAYNNRGALYEEKGELGLAIRDYSRALELNPRFAPAFYNRGHAYSKQGDLDRAIEDYSRALDLNPKFAEACSNRSAVYLAKGVLNQALADSNRALDLNPKYAEGYLNRGLVFAKRMDLDRAIADFSKALKLEPKFVEVLNNRGLAYYKNGNFSQALADYNRCLELNPQYALAYYNKGELFNKINKGKQALEAYQDFLKYAHPEEKGRIQQAQNRIKALGKEILPTKLSSQLAASGAGKTLQAGMVISKTPPPPAPVSETITKPTEASSSWTDYLKESVYAMARVIGISNSEAERQTSPPVKYVGSITSNKYHYPNCKWAKTISPKKVRGFTSVADAKKAGYRACPTCNPPLSGSSE